MREVADAVSNEPALHAIVDSACEYRRFFPSWFCLGEEIEDLLCFSFAGMCLK